MDGFYGLIACCLGISPRHFLDRDFAGLMEIYSRQRSKRHQKEYIITLEVCYR